MNAHYDKQKIKDWLRNLARTTGDTPSGIARKSGLSESTLTRFLADETDRQGFSPKSVAKIVTRFGVDPPGDMVLPIAQAGNDGMSEPEALLYQVPLETKSDAKYDPIKRAIQSLSMNDITTPWTLNSRALECAGYLPGDLLFIDLNAQPLRADVVCAQVYNNRLGTAQTVMRLYEPPYLVASTYDPALRRTLVADGENVVIKGVCIASLRPRTAR